MIGMPLLWHEQHRYILSLLISDIGDIGHDIAAATTRLILVDKISFLLLLTLHCLVLVRSVEIDVALADHCERARAAPEHTYSEPTDYRR